MERILGADVEPAANGVGRPGFRAGTPGINAGTEISPKWLNEVQEEIVNTIIASGLTPSNAQNQLNVALNMRIAAALDTLSINNTFRNDAFVWSGVHSFLANLTVGPSATLAATAANLQHVVATDIECAQFSATAADAYQFATPRARAVLLPVQQAVPTYDSEAWELREGNLWIATGATTDKLVWSLYPAIPLDAQLLDFRFGLGPSGVTSTDNLLIELVRMTINTGASTTTETVLTSFTSNANSNNVPQFSAFSSYPFTLPTISESTTQLAFRFTRLAGTPQIRWAQVTYAQARL